DSCLLTTGDLIARRFESECRGLITERCDVRHCRTVHADEILAVHRSSRTWATGHRNFPASRSTKEGGMGGRPFRSVCGSLVFLVLLLSLAVLSVQESLAIPAFSRMYGTSCSTC